MTENDCRNEATRVAAGEAIDFKPVPAIPTGVNKIRCINLYTGAREWIDPSDSPWEAGWYPFKNAGEELKAIQGGRTWLRAKQKLLESSSESTTDSSESMAEATT